MELKTATSELDLRNTVDWVDWMQTAFESSGFDLPNDETCVLFAGSALRFTERIRPMTTHLPTVWRTKLIQAAILHQYWHQRATARKRDAADLSPRLPAVMAREIVCRHSNGLYFADAEDGFRYLVRFPQKERPMLLASEAIGFWLAREMGLPAPQPNIVLLSSACAMAGGILLAKQGANFVSCLATRYDYQEIHAYESSPTLPPGRATRRYLAGAAVVDILLSSSMPTVPAFRERRGRAEVIFQSYAHCFIDGDWQRFLNSHEDPRIIPQSYNLTSPGQLDVWIRRVEQLRRRGLWELAFRLPHEWFAGECELLVGLLNTLDQRIASLRGLAFQFMGNGATGAHSDRSRSLSVV